MPAFLDMSQALVRTDSPYDDDKRWDRVDTADDPEGEYLKTPEGELF